MKGFSGLAHVAIKVADLDRTLDFYVNKLGFAEMLRLNNEDGDVWLVYLRITDDQYLEVFPGAEGERAPGWNANGMNHICLAVDDIESVVREIEALGIPLLMPLKLALDGNWQAWIEDPDGNRIELMQMDPNSAQLQAIERIRREAAMA